jgi:hypothetical protein
MNKTMRQSNRELRNRARRIFQMSHTRNLQRNGGRAATTVAALTGVAPPDARLAQSVLK